MIVAQLRGANFKEDKDGMWISAGSSAAYLALEDVVEWLGYGVGEDTHNRDQYLNDLPVLKEKIFERARQGANDDPLRP